jgi:RNA polymerase sigma-70 factor (ECF subfamily)
VYEADREIVARMLAGERRAFDDFFEASAPRLMAFAARRSGLDAASLEDVVQNALIKAIHSLASYRGEAALFTWVSDICRHELADVHRKATRQPVHVSLFEPGDTQVAVTQLQAPEHLEPIAVLDALQGRAAVMRVMDSLPKPYALALEAKYGDGLAVRDVANLLGLTMMATQSLLARARKAFRQQWQERSDGAVSGGALP